MRTVRLRVTLREVVPRVLRVIDVPDTSTLPELHNLMQAAVGWTDSHLHQFDAGDIRYGVPHEEWDDDQKDEATARLRDLPERFVYVYDFGDAWTHDVEVLGPGADRSGCVYGEGSCPPEDCGGPRGYAELLRSSPIPGTTSTSRCATGPVSWRRSTRPTPTFWCVAPWERCHPACG
jgi:hypothetical protein